MSTAGSPIIQGLITIVKAICFLGIYILCETYVPINFMYTVEYKNSVFWYKIWYFMASGYTLRFFYYAPFCFTTAAF